MGNKEKNFVSAVIYVHNAEDQVEPFLNAVIGVMEANFEHSEIICVNDASDDGSLAAIRRTSSAAGSTSVSVVNMSSYHGVEGAMSAGVDLSIGDFVFEFDSTNLDFHPDEVMNVYRRSLTGFDIVSAVPRRRERLSSRLFYRVFDRFSVSPYKMMTERFRILSRRVINRISSMNATIPYRKAVYAKCGLKTDHIQYEVQTGAGSGSRDKKESDYRLGLAVDSLILFTEFGYRFSMVMTVLMMLISISMAVYSVAVYLLSHPVAGWSTTILFLSVAFFGLFAILTIIIKYLQLLLDLSIKKKHYTFESIEKLTT